MADVNQDLLPMASSPAATDVVTGVFGGISKNIPVPQLLAGLLNKQTGTNYTLQLTDGGAIVEMNNSASNTVTIPPSSSVNFPLGTQICIGQAGSGSTSIIAGAGVTIQNPGAIGGQWKQGFLYKRGADEWVFSSGGSSLITPAAPTAGTVNDTPGIDTFDFTYNPTYTIVSDYEYTLDGGVNVFTLSAKPLVVGNVAKAIGQVGVRVKAHTGTNPSAWLFNASAFTTSGLPSLNAPVLTGGTPTNTTEPLTWTDTNTSPNEASFEIQYSSDAGSTWNAGPNPAANATSGTVTGLTAGTAYQVRIRAVGDGTTASTSAWSNVVSFTTTGGSSAMTLPANSGYTLTSSRYTVTGGGVAWGNSGVSDQYGASTTDILVYLKYVSGDADGFLGLHDINLGIKFANMRVCFRITGGTLESRESGTATSRGSATINSFYGLKRIGSSGVITLVSSTDEVTWTTIATLGYTSTGALYVVSDINGGGAISLLKGTGFVAIPTVSGSAGTAIAFATSSGLTNTSQVFTPTTNTGAYGNKGLDAKSLAVSTTGRIFEKWTGGLDAFFGFSTANSNAGLSGVFAGFLISSSDKSIFKTESGSSATVNGDAGLNYYYSIYRDGSTGAFKIGRSSDGLNWMDTGITYTNNSTAQLFILCDLFGGSSTKLDHPQGNSIT